MSTSKLQRQVKQLLLNYYGGFTILENCRPEWMISSRGERLELDFYIEELSVAIEVQGEQHYCLVPHFHNDLNGFRKQQRRDEEKRIICQDCGVALLEIGDSVDLKEATDTINTLINNFRLKYPDSMRKVTNREKRIKMLSDLIIERREQLEKTRRNLLKGRTNPKRVRRLRRAVVQSELLLMRYQALLARNVSVLKKRQADRL